MERLTNIWPIRFFNGSFKGFFSGHQSNFQPPPYYNNGSSVMYHNNSSASSAVTDPRSPNYRCPYYQLYGPPPSYDSVVQITNPSNTGEQQTCIVLSSNHSTAAVVNGGATNTDAVTIETTSNYQQPSTSTLRSEDIANNVDQPISDSQCNSSDQSEIVNVRKNISNISSSSTPNVESSAINSQIVTDTNNLLSSTSPATSVQTTSNFW